MLEAYWEGRGVFHRDALVQPCALHVDRFSQSSFGLDSSCRHVLVRCAGDMRAKVVSIAMRSARGSGFFGVGEVKQGVAVAQ